MFRLLTPFFATLLSLKIGFTAAQTQTLYEVVAGNTNLTTLKAAIDASPEVVDLLNDAAAQLTVFAPSNAAFEALDQTFLQALLTPEWAGHLFILLSYHVVFLEYSSNALMDGVLETLNEQNVTIDLPDGGPPTVNGNNVIAADIDASNGIVHVIDGVLLPDGFDMNIVEQGQALPDFFSTLVSLATAAGLDTALSGSGPLTLFAPTNDAFSALDPADVAYLQDPANLDVLTTVLQYHVVQGNVYMFTLDNGSTNQFLTLQGENVTVVVSDDGETYAINKANASSCCVDATASNGLIHILDGVLIPDSVTTLPSMSTNSSTTETSNSTESPTAASTTTKAPTAASTTTKSPTAASTPTNSQPETSSSLRISSTFAFMVGLVCLV